MADTTKKKGRGRPATKKKPTNTEEDTDGVVESKKKPEDKLEFDNDLDNDEIVEEKETDIKEEKHMEDVVEFEEVKETNKDYSPINDDVIHRGYEQGSAQLTDEAVEIPIPELTFDGDQGGEDIPDNNHPKPSTQTSENKQGSGGSVQSSASAQNNNKTTGHDAKIISQPQQSQKTDRTNAEKRKDAVKSADALLQVYQNNIPELFKHFAKFNEGKISRMELNGEIDRAMPVLADGTTVGQYISSVNRQIDQNFVITEDMKNEIREPLIDWLMEKGVELTPTQRLIMAVGSQIASFGMATVKQWQENRHALNQFAEYHADWKKHKGDIPVSPRPETPTEHQATDYVPDENQTGLTVAEDENMIDHNDVEVEDIPNESEELNLDDYMQDK